MSKKTIIIVLAVVVVAILAGLAIGINIYKKNSEPKEVVKYSLTLDDMYCNIKDSKRIMKLRVTVETLDEKFIETLTEKQFLIRDEINKTVRNKTEDDLEGENGQINLQENIKENLVNLFENESITNVYFNDFIIQ